MGSYTELYIADYPVYSTKSYVDPVVMIIFQESDKNIYERKVSNRNKIVWGDLEDNEIEMAVEYSASVENIKERLDVLGFSLSKAIDNFYNCISLKIDEIGEMLENASSNSDLAKELLSEREMLQCSNLQDWLNAYKVIFERKITAKDIDKIESEHVILKYILSSSEHELDYKIPFTDIRFVLRLLTEVAPQDALVTQDITEVVSAGYYEEDTPVCEFSVKQLTKDYPVNEKIIILTEGSSDIYVLKKSLTLLYPHLSQYYSFMDFKLSSAAGGVGSLVATIKAFVGAGISNRVIAIFDNDTAALAARKQLDKLQFSENFRVMCYPDIELAKNYPTLGPNGITYMDVNGLACSIEMYFGEDILTQNGNLVPVQWKGYEASLDQYQGEILRKGDLQNAFFGKVDACMKNPSIINAKDGSSIRLVLRQIFLAFT